MTIALAVIAGLMAMQGTTGAAPQRQQAASIQGHVYVDGVLSQSSRVTAYAGNSAPQQRDTSDTGRYSMDLIGNGQQITFQIDGQPAKSYDTTGSETIFTATPGSSLTVNLAPASETHLSGIVDPAPADQFAEFTGTVYAGQGAVYASARVSISLDNGANWPHSGTTNASGNYRMRIPSDRTKTVSFMVNGAQSRQWTRYGRRTVEGTIKAAPGTVQVIDLVTQGAGDPPKLTPPAPGPSPTPAPTSAATPVLPPADTPVPPPADTPVPPPADTPVPPPADTPVPPPAATPTAVPAPTAAPPPTAVPVPTATRAAPVTPPASFLDAFRQGPTVRLRPVNDVIDQNKDGIVEVLFRNPALNETIMVVDLTVSVPAGIHIYGENYAQSSAAGAASNVYRVLPGQSQTIKLYIKSEKVGRYTIDFSSTYWPENNRDLNNPVSLTHPFDVRAPSPNPLSATPTDPAEQVAQAPAAAPTSPPAAAPTSPPAAPQRQDSDPSASCSLSPEGGAGNADLALLAIPMAGLLGMMAIRRRRN